VELAISKLSNKKASDEDGLTAEHIKHASASSGDFYLLSSTESSSSQKHLIKSNVASLTQFQRKINPPTFQQMLAVSQSHLLLVRFWTPSSSPIT